MVVGLTEDVDGNIGRPAAGQGSSCAYAIFRYATCSLPRKFRLELITSRRTQAEGFGLRHRETPR